MGIEEDRAVKAAQDTTIRETENGYRVLGAPEKSITHQHNIDRIPEVDITQEMLNETADNPESWLMYGGGYEQHRYTTCDVITKDNVADLELEHDMAVGAGSSMEGTPLIVPGDPPIMYQSNGPNYIKAIDPREAEVLWSYTYAVPNDVVLCCDDNNRGPAVFGDKVFMTTLDSGVVALDRYTGEEEWYHSTEDHERSYSATWAPMIYDGTLFTGSAGGEYGVRGFHTAIDTESGDEKWRINISSETEWVGDSIHQSSCTNWMTATVDHENGRLYMPTGNPAPVFDGSVRPGPNRNGCGTLCLDLETGEELWFHQESTHDIWDYDSAMPRILIRDVEVRGKTRDVVVSVGKTAWLYTMDAETGELLVRSEPGAQQLNMFRMIPHIAEGRRLPFMPGSIGGNNWQPGCYNPELGLTYHKLHNSFQEAWWRFEEFEPGKKYWGGILEDETDEVPDEYNGHISGITAFDPLTGETAWQDWIDSDVYLWGGTMATKTGLMFAGTQNGNLVGYDGESGERLWEFDAGDAPISGDPVSWYDPGTEKQYVAIQVGGSGWLRRGQRDDRLLIFSTEGVDESIDIHGTDTASEYDSKELDQLEDHLDNKNFYIELASEIHENPNYREQLIEAVMDKANEADLLQGELEKISQSESDDNLITEATVATDVTADSLSEDVAKSMQEVAAREVNERVVAPLLLGTAVLLLIGAVGSAIDGSLILAAVLLPVPLITVYYLVKARQLWT